MDFLSIKILAPLTLSLAIISPPVLYKGANLYIEAYNTSSNYLQNKWEQALGSIGLQKKRDEQALDVYIESASNKYNLNPKLLSCLINQESSKNSDAFSPKGAIGLAQIMPFNSKRCGLAKVSKLWDDETNINCGAQILSEELITYKRNLEKALFAYNGGSKAFEKKFPESVDYSKKITACFAQSALK